VLAFGLPYFCIVVNVYGISFRVGEIVDNGQAGGAGGVRGAGKVSARIGRRP
jgi:hypothetical protein